MSEQALIDLINATNNGNDLLITITVVTIIGATIVFRMYLKKENKDKEDLKQVNKEQMNCIKEFSKAMEQNTKAIEKIDTRMDKIEYKVDSMFYDNRNNNSNVLEMKNVRRTKEYE